MFELLQRKVAAAAAAEEQEADCLPFRLSLIIGLVSRVLRSDNAECNLGVIGEVMNRFAAVSYNNSSCCG